MKKKQKQRTQHVRTLEAAKTPSESISIMNDPPLPKHPIDMPCTTCSASEELVCDHMYCSGTITRVNGQPYHLSRIHAARAANELADVRADNAKLRDICELQARTLERALKRIQGRSIIADSTHPSCECGLVFVGDRAEAIEHAKSTQHRVRGLFHPLPELYRG